MAPSRICPNGLKVTVTVALIFSITFLPPSSVGTLNSRHSESSLQRSNMVLGSKPPACVNKCLSCRPCMATLVIPSHQWKNFRAAYHGDEDDNYYLLSWKCKCGDKLFQP
ncbi:EPIDERMAL PATTERNING FACTOR-like protein 8 [Durio zibethinus]|uniref:Epidermal patterning factor-like protein n=1 Tax=Durio zibethinus TaxID=66656 RepID=A0A6P5X902_DURZI|nr:EPIDERMAL PATTERNING FACTOR-like protein 8 [Durio zibethinus]